MALAAGCLLAFLLTLPKAIQVWSTGAFLNPDDAMRAVEVRDLMAGQGWFDLVQHRLSPDHPFPMHWSRLVDVPLAGMVHLFALVVSPTSAERAMRVMEPSLLFLLSLATMIGLVRRLMGPSAMIPAALLLGGSVEVVSNFIPGHIHHHAIQGTLLLGAVKLLTDALEENGRWRALVAGVLAAVSLGIGLQNLPFVMALAAIAGLSWVVMGRASASLLGSFGVGLATTALVVFMLDVPPAHYTAGICDAFSAAHLFAAGGCGLCFLALSFSSEFAGVWPKRLALATATAVLVVGLVAFTYPACLHDPMAGVDPLLRTQWLANVGEALPLARLIELDPFGGSALLLTLVVGLAATAFAASIDGPHRPSWAALLLLCIVGFAGTLWQVRVAAPACALMVPGITFAVLAAHDRLARNPRRPALLLATLVGMLGNGAGLNAGATALQAAESPVAANNGGIGKPNPARCFEPAAFVEMEALPPGLVLSTIDPGSMILAYTHHSVLAAPYHRNSYGNRVALLALNMTPAEARPIIEGAKAKYLALCKTSNETIESAQLHPESLSASVLAGQVPAWLTSVGSKDSLFQVFRINTASSASEPSQD